MRISVRPSALAGAAVETRRTGGVLSASLTELTSTIEPLRRSWTGAAAAGFTERHAQWHSAATGMVSTLDQLAALVERAHGNYTAAGSANLDIWSGAALPAGIDADLDDVRAAVRALDAVADATAASWTGLAGRLAPTASMAGDDRVGAGFGADHDTMVAVVWQGWRAAAIMSGSVAGGLAATGANILAAERDSRSRPGTDAPIASTAVAVPSPTRPASAIGSTAADPVALLPIVASYWPAANPARLRAVAEPWLAAKGLVREHAATARSVIGRLVAANPDPALAQMRAFTEAVWADDPSGSLFGALALANGQVAEACRLMAEITEQTRTRMMAEIRRIMGGGEWYHDVAGAADVVLTRGAARIVATAGDLAMLDLSLSRLHAEYASEVEGARGEISRAAADRLAQLATLQPPRPLVAGTIALPDDGVRTALIAELRATGRKVNPAEVVQIARAPDGRIVWLERGTATAGLTHILRANRIAEFAARGVPPGDVPGIAIRALTEGVPIGRSGRGGVVYAVDVGGGKREKIVVIEAENGFVVSTYPLGSREKVKPL